MQQIVAREGVSGLYAGLSSALFGISLTNFVYYYWYEWTRAAFEAAAAKKPGRASTRLTAVESMVAGAIAGGAVVVLTNPIWVINTRMTTRAHAAAEQARAGPEKKGGGGGGGGGGLPSPASASAAKRMPKRKPPTTLGTLLSLLKNEGPLALWAGVIPALVLVINPILQYTFFEQMKNAIERRRRVTPTVAFVLGALGKLVATSVTYPYITVKSQMHVASDGGKKREGMVQAIRRLLHEEGHAGLYKGTSTAPAAFHASD